MIRAILPIDVYKRQEIASEIGCKNMVLQEKTLLGWKDIPIRDHYDYDTDDYAGAVAVSYTHLYYARIAEALPEQSIYLYNFPDRTGYDLTPEITLRLVRKYRNIVGYKDTQAGMDHTRELIKLVKGEFPAFEVYSGFDDNFAHNVLAGGDGCIAGLSNCLLYTSRCV